MKLWLDDVRPAPEGYVHCLSVNQAILKIQTALGGFVRAIELALDSHYDEEDKVIEIKCRKIKENKNGWKEI